MKKFIKSLPLFIATIPLVATRTATALPSEHGENIEPLAPDLAPVQLRPLNHGLENLFASHSSHSSHSSHASHASHASHYSGSTGGDGYGTTQNTTPAQNLVSHPEVPPTTSSAPSTPAPILSTAEKRKLQIMRVQIALVGLGLYSGIVNGTLNNGTKESLKRFQRLKGLPADGRMGTSTLNALGVMAVQ